MRKLIFLVLFLSFFSIRGISKEDDSRLIRRLYLDNIGLVPTIEEMEWYIVYNDNSYELAVNYISNHPQNRLKALTVEEKIKLFNSKEYKQSKRLKLSKEELSKNIFYVSGCDKTYGLEYAKKRIISNSIKNDTSIDIIDYMANLFMCRSTKLTEANYLLQIYRKSESLHFAEEDRWFMVLEEILKFDEVNNY